MAGIYKISCLTSGKIYIGSSTCPESRWHSHKVALRANRHVNRYLQRAWNKYGEDDFNFCIVEQTERLLECEQFWLDKTKCYDRKIGFNISKIAGQPCHNGMGEDVAIDRLNNIINRYGVVSNLPKRDNPNDVDRSYALWIYSMRRARSLKGSNNWYPILDLIAQKSGFGGMFDSRESVAIDRLKAIIQSYKSLNNLPSARSSDRNKQSDARWLIKKRQAKHNKDGRTWYPVLEQIATDNGFAGLFDYRI